MADGRIIDDLCELVNDLKGRVSTLEERLARMEARAEQAQPQPMIAIVGDNPRAPFVYHHDIPWPPKGPTDDVSHFKS